MMGFLFCFTLRTNFKQVFQGHWSTGFQHALDLCGLHSGEQRLHVKLGLQRTNILIINSSGYNFRCLSYYTVTVRKPI